MEVRMKDIIMNLVVNSGEARSKALVILDLAKEFVELYERQEKA